MAGLNGGGHPLDNGRYGGGSAGPETRYCQDAVDCDRHDQATEGAESRSPLHKEMRREPASRVNTMRGGRGDSNGASYPRDKGQRGF